MAGMGTSKQTKGRRRLDFLKFSRKFKGFTITEVVIVLAVAGTIVAIVLATVPQASRNQRDNSRKTLSQRLMSSLENYNGNNQGTYPFSGPSGTGSSPPVSWTDCKTVVGGSPSQTCYDWFNNYLSGGKVNLQDPSCGSDIGIFYSSISSPNPSYSTWTCTAGPTNVQPGSIYIGVGDVCSGSKIAAGPVVGTATSKQFAVLVALENPGVWYCTDNR